MHLQENIRIIITRRRLTYHAFGEAVGATEGMVKTYVTKGATPPLPILCAIADFAGITLDQLVRYPLDSEAYRPTIVNGLEQRMQDVEKRLKYLENAQKKAMLSAMR